MGRRVRGNDPMVEMLKASTQVRDGRWIRGAPSHVLAEFLTRIENDGWRLVKIADMFDAAREAIAKDMGCDDPRCRTCANRARLVGNAIVGGES